MSITPDANGTDQFFFWFQPSTNPAAAKEIVIWLNGGVSSVACRFKDHQHTHIHTYTQCIYIANFQLPQPGCSSLEGLLQENGPFSWQYGTFKPVQNPWSWNRLTNMLWVEQPINTGFSTGKVTATSEEDVARQFLGFFRNFVETFSMQGFKVYITGESYAYV